jgi:Hemerythrin HHE cation binding domain
MPGIIDLVLKDHLKVAALFEELTSAKTAGKQKSLFTEVTGALEAHATAEEKVLYPRVRKDVCWPDDPGGSRSHRKTLLLTAMAWSRVAAGMGGRRSCSCKDLPGPLLSRITSG